MRLQITNEIGSGPAGNRRSALPLVCTPHILVKLSGMGVGQQMDEIISSGFNQSAHVVKQKGPDSLADIVGMNEHMLEPDTGGEH